MLKKICAQSLREGGFVLVTSYFFIAVLSVMSLAFLMRGNVFLNAVERNINRIVAFNMADGAVDLAIAQLQGNSNYAGSGGYASLGTGGGYEVAVCPPTCSGLTQPTNSSVRLIQTTGHAPSSNTGDRAYESRTLTVYVQFEESKPFDYAVFADGNISLAGNAETDSYDSRNGAYGGTNVSDNGDIATNSTSDDTVTLSGNAEVNGNAITGPDSTPGDVINLSGNASISGDSTAADELRTFETADDVSVSVSAGDSLSVSGNNTVYLNGGTYNYSSVTISGNGEVITLGAVTFNVSGNVNITSNDGLTAQSSISLNVGGSFSLSGNADVTTAGDTTINTVGTFSISGNGSLDPGGSTTVTVSSNVSITGNGVATYNNDPTQFIMNVTNSSTVQISGNGDFFGAVYAPESDVTVSGNGDIHGAVVSEEFQCSGNCKIHYDEALEDVSVSTVNSIEVLSWIENDTVAAS